MGGGAEGCLCLVLPLGSDSTNEAGNAFDPLIQSSLYLYHIIKRIIRQVRFSVIHE